MSAILSLFDNVHWPMNDFFLQIMGILESRPAQNSAPTSSPTESPREQNDEQFKTEVRKSAENFKNLVMNNKIMMFSATYCSYCTVAKVKRCMSCDLI